MEHHASFGILLRKPTKSAGSSFGSHCDQLEDVDLPPAHVAAARGELGTLVRVIQRDPSMLEQHSSEGLTPLAQAVLCQQRESMKKLVQLGANVDAQDNVGRTCLSIAAYQGWHKGVMFLLRNGAKQSICDKSGRYPVHAATYHSDMSTLTLLLNGLTVKEINIPDHEQMTAVHWAAFHDRPEHLMELVRRGGDVLAKDVDGKLPLHWAAQNNSFQCVHRLTSLSEGYSTINDVDLSGKSPLHYAAAAGATNIVKILSRCDGIILDFEDPDERTPLHWAAAMGHPKTVELLLQLGVKPFPMDVDGGTPLEYAFQAGNKECVKVMEEFLGSHKVRSRIHSHQAIRDGRDDIEGEAELRYHFARQAPSSPSFNDDGIPKIKLQPPTTKTNTHNNHTHTTQHTNELHGHRAQSGSTDTPHTLSDAVTVRAVECSDGAVNVNELSNALNELVGSTFKVGAQAPILLSDETKEEQQIWSTKLAHPETLGPAKPSDHGDGQFTSGAVQDTKNQELNVNTSMNTPELQRVSVQSFRSIPPIPSKADDGTGETPLRVSPLLDYLSDISKDSHNV